MDEVAFIVVIAALFLSAPVLAIVALVRVAGFERRLRELERRMARAAHEPPGSLRQPAAAPETAPPAGAPAPVPQAPPPTPAPVGPSGASGVDLEAWIGGRGLNRLGIVALLIATAFFLKYAFDNRWIGPRGRITIGLLAGVSLLVYSQTLWRRGYRYFSEGMAGLGAGVLYLSLYAAWDFYHLVPQPAAFAAMVAVTAALIAVAMGRDSERLAFLALVGGFLTPGLLSTGRDAQVVLFTYLALLNAGLLALAFLRQWRSLALAALLPTLIYYWGWENAFYSADKLLRTAAFATVFFVEFSAVPVIQGRRDGTFRWEQALLLVVNASSFLIALHELLYDEHRWALTLAVLVLSAAHTAVVGLVPPREGQAVSTARLVFSGLALTFVTLAIPIRLEGKWITIAWGVEGVVLVFSGFRAATPWLRGAGGLLHGIVVLRLLLYSIQTDRFLLNPRFVTFAAAVACFAISVWLARANEPLTSALERKAFAVLAITATAFAVAALSMELWDLFGRLPGRTGAERTLAQQLSLSLLWTAYGAGLILTGVRWKSAGLRWQGLVLLGLAVGKVFLYDLSSLERVYRIASFVVLGMLLLVVSFFYQKRLAAGGAREDP